MDTEHLSSLIEEDKKARSDSIFRWFYGRNYKSWKSG